MFRIAFFALFAVALARHHHRTKREAKDDVETILNSVMREFINGDMESVMAHYVENSMVISGKGKLYKGLDQIKGYFGTYGGSTTDGTFTVSNIVTDGALAGAIGQTVIHWKKDEVVKEMKRTWIGVFRHVGDDYKILFEGIFTGDGSGDAARMKRATVQEQIQARHDDFLKKLGEGKMTEAMADSYMDDAQYVKPNGAIVTGQADIGAYLMEMAKTIENPSTEINEVIDSTGMAVEIGVTKYTTNSTAHSMRHVAVWKKVDGNVKVAIDSMFFGDGDFIHPDIQ